MLEITKRETTVKPCIECGDPGGRTRTKRHREYVIRMHGRCARCADRIYNQNRKKSGPRPKPEIKPCTKCGTETGRSRPGGTFYRIKGMCKKCYDASDRLKKTACIDCKKIGGKRAKGGRLIRIYGRCVDCHAAWKISRHGVIDPCIICSTPDGACGRMGKPLRKKGMCRDCYKVHGQGLGTRPAIGGKICLKCGTSEGTIDPRTGRTIRKKGMCSKCYWAWWEDGKIAKAENGLPKPPSLKEIKQSAFEAKRLAQEKILVSDPGGVFIPKELSEEKKRARTRSWVQEVIRAEKMLKAWVIRQSRLESEQASPEPSPLQALLSA